MRKAQEITVASIQSLTVAYSSYWRTLHRIHCEWFYLDQTLPTEETAKRRRLAQVRFQHEVLAGGASLEHFIETGEYALVGDNEWSPDYIWETTRRARAWFRTYWRELAPTEATAAAEPWQAILHADSPNVSEEIAKRETRLAWLCNPRP